MADLKKKKDEEVAKFTDGQKVFVPKATFAFDTELIEVFNVFQDDGEEAILLVDRNGHIMLRARTMVFGEIEIAKQYYLNWMRVMHDKLAESWFPKPTEEAPVETTEN
jgi:hypothetical protein